MNEPQNEARSRLASEKDALSREPMPPPPTRVSVGQILEMILQRLSLMEVMLGRVHDILMSIAVVGEPPPRDPEVEHPQDGSEEQVKIADKKPIDVPDPQS